MASVLSIGRYALLVVLVSAGTGIAGEPDNQVRLHAHFQQLPAAGIRPKRCLEANSMAIADSWPLRQARDQHPEICGSYWQRLKFLKDGSLNAGPDYAAYFGDGFIRLAHLLPDSELAKELKPWLERVLASQDASGYPMTPSMPLAPMKLDERIETIRLVLRLHTPAAELLAMDGQVNRNDAWRKGSV